MNFKNARIVVKLGSSLLVDHQSHTIKHQWLASFIEDVNLLIQQGCQVVVVSSGSVALGCQILNFHRKQLSIEKKQAAAAVGQIHLSQAYHTLLYNYDLIAAQILLSLDDSEDRKRFLNARNTMTTLLKLGMVPIVNENDTVATSEIEYGDNDRLAARVAQMIEADMLILLSDIDGLYDRDPKQDVNAKFVERVPQLTESIMSMGTDSLSNFGSGGMKTKLAAAKIATSHGIQMLITRGEPINPIQTYLKTKRGTWFESAPKGITSKKAWIREHLKPRGTIYVDTGAANAIKQGKSLLAVGITACEGRFQKGDVISIATEDHMILARGLSNYTQQEVMQIKGLPSASLTNALGYQGISEVVHCDNMVRIES